MPFNQILDVVRNPNWKEEYLQSQRQFEPGIRAKKAVKDFSRSEIALPLTEKGWPNLGAVLGGLTDSAADLSIPETKEDAFFAAIPFSKFTKGADNKVMSNAVGLLDPVEREKALKRTNAWEAIRKALGNHKDLKEEIKRANDLGDNIWWKDLEQRHGRLGGGVYRAFACDRSS